MATWHTDNLLGNDTTGNGSAALPWKSINRAVSASTNGDTIKIAGSDIVDVPGLTLTWTGTTQYVANITPSGIVAGDVISLTHPEFGADKYFFRVHSISGNIVTLNGAFTPGAAMPVRKFSQIHYASTTSVTFESITTTKFSLRFLAGWDSTFTTQNGWTVARFQGGAVNTQGCQFMANTVNLPQNCYFEKFAFVQLTTGFVGGAGVVLYGDLIGSRTASMFGSTPTNEIGYEPKWYMNLSNCQVGTNTTYTGATNTYGLNLSEMYINCSTDNIGWVNCGGKFNNVYVCNEGQNWLNGNIQLIPSKATVEVGDVYLYTNSNASNLKVLNSSNSCYWNGRLFTSGSGFSNLYTGDNNQAGNIFWNNPTQNISTFRWWFQPNGPTIFARQNYFMVKDIEGDKSITYNGITFIDTTDYLTAPNSLKLTRPNNQTTKYIIKQFFVNSGTTGVTISVTAKSSASVGAETLGVSIFGRILNPTSNITLTTSWATYTWNINVTSNISMRNSLNALYIEARSSATVGSYLWIDDVTITQS